MDEHYNVFWASGLSGFVWSLDLCEGISAIRNCIPALLIVPSETVPQDLAIFIPAALTDIITPMMNDDPQPCQKSLTLQERSCYSIHAHLIW